ncbi:hypothetical protein H8D30_00990 [bacterium]|nr:hypothetical protein [bacterium]
MCGKKRAYSSKAKAKKMAEMMWDKRGHRVNHYKCLYCGKWHLGNPPKKQ